MESRLGVRVKHNSSLVFFDGRYLLAALFMRLYFTQFFNGLLIFFGYLSEKIMISYVVILLGCSFVAYSLNF
jgi:hypothetical protein